MATDSLALRWRLAARRLTTLCRPIWQALAYGVHSFSWTQCVDSYALLALLGLALASSQVSAQANKPAPASPCARAVYLTFDTGHKIGRAHV